MPVVAGGLIAPALPELATVDCPECGNDGGCDTCAGTGQLEVCSGCRTVPTVKNGVDFCRCVAVVELEHAA